ASVMRYIGTGTPQNEQQARAWLEKNKLRSAQRNFGIWAVTPKEGKTLLGWCGLAILDDTDEVEVGYGLAHPHWGKRITPEGARANLHYGFKVINLERIVAVALPENTASRRVMERLGMKYEKDAYYYGCNVVYYAVSRDEFKSRPAPFRMKHSGD
ncbi:MAG TPA: GNAT family N-acetyltransferase, partial [Pyrinomonadaceae bacterium]|nr:GNAT family N-acetyltransferase [Pyrinomonadaceae bacterium]